MKALLIRSDVGLAGPAKLMQAYAIAIRNSGHQVIIASGGGDFLPEIESDGFRHVTVPGLRIGSRNPLRAIKHISSIASLIHGERIDIVNSFNAHAGLLAQLADPFSRAKHFNTVLGTGKEWANRFLANPIFPGRIIAVSKDVQQKLIAAGIPQKRISVIYNSILTDRYFTPVPDRSGRNTLRICSIAMFTGNKGQEVILPLVARLIERGHDVHLTLVGDGPSRPNCEMMAKSLGIEDRVKFTGAIIDVIPELDASDIFLHLPKTETFGIVLAEAMARALPVVTVRVGGIPEVVSEGETAFLVDTRDSTDALVAAIEKLLSDPSSRGAMGNAGRERAREKFSLHALQRDLMAAYS